MNVTLFSLPLQSKKMALLPLGFVFFNHRLQVNVEFIWLE